jgi:hypothetical protein
MPALVYIPPRLVSFLVNLQQHQDTSFLFHESYNTHLMISSGRSSGDIFGNLPLKKIAH